MTTDWSNSIDPVVWIIFEPLFDGTAASCCSGG